MKKTLVLFAHPRLEQSTINTALVSAIPREDWLTLHDLYEVYPNFNIDVESEKALLRDHEIIVWHHPFYWYSCPPLLKQWIDMVLEFGWAYGPGGTALKGKKAFNVITTGGARDAYSSEGRNRFSIHEFLAPFNQTARLCKMEYLPPFAVQGTHRLSDEEIGEYAERYAGVLRGLSAGTLDTASLPTNAFLSDFSADQLKEVQ